ncbi:MAG: DNA polymerase I, partial [Gammaproteobacteria bacterium]
MENQKESGRRKYCRRRQKCGIIAGMRLLLVDATGYLFRAFFAVRELRSKDGFPTGAIFGLANMLHKLRAQWPAERVACVMDAPGKTFRHELSPAYKANRPPLDEDLRVQIAPAKEFILAAGWPLVCESGVEADDVIATLAAQGRRAGMEIVVASGDKDLMQLVGGDAVLYDGLKDAVYDEDAVRKKFGVPPAQMADYLSLVGDSSDNIRGVEKVGAKTAAKWLGEFGSLDGALKQARADESLPEKERKLKGAAGGNLRAAADSGVLALAQKLTALKTDVALPLSAEECIAAAPDVKKWRALCEQYGFRQLAAEWDSAPSANGRAKTEIVTELSRLRKWVAAARKNGAAIDTETDGAPVMQSTIVGFSLAFEDGTAAYIPLAHRGMARAKQIPAADALEALRPLLEDEKAEKIFHNGKYDLHVFANCGLAARGVLEDTKIAAALREPGQPTSLGALAQKYLNVKTVAYRDIVDGKTVKHFSESDIPAAAQYAGEDAEITRKLRAPVIGELRGKARRLYETTDRPLMPVLFAMERAGVKIDGGALKNLAKEMRARMLELESEAHQIAGAAFNLNSPRQLETLLFDKMGAPPLRKTAGGKARSTDERTLDALAADYPLARAVLRHRTLAKLTGTYAEKLPRMTHPQTGRVHTDFNQTAVHTGRLSSSDPNLQNIPARTADGRRIRRAFVAPDGCALISADYSQIELRLMAHISGDDALLAAFAEGADIHRRTAAEVFGKAESEIGNDERRAAKAINFGLIYGMSAFGLARALNTSRERAREYIERYFARYPQVAAYMENIRKHAAAQGFVETLAGRRIPVAGGNPQAAARAAINAPMQGSAADIIKTAMLRIHDFLTKHKMQTRMLLQVHDELVLESPNAETDEIA